MRCGVCGHILRVHSRVAVRKCDTFRLRTGLFIMFEDDGVVYDDLLESESH